MIVKARFLDRAAFTTTGPKAGTIEVDGMVIGHARMSRVDLVAASARAATVGDFTYPAGRDASITVGTDSSDPTQLTLPGVDLTAQSGATGVNLEPLVKDVTNKVTVSANGAIDTSKTGGTAGDITFEAANIEVQSTPTSATRSRPRPRG